MKRPYKKVVLIGFDASAIIASSLLSRLFLDPFIIIPPTRFWFTVILSGGIYFSIALYFKFFSKINRYISIKEALLQIGLITLSFIMTNFIMNSFVGGISFRLILLTYIFAVASIPGSRIIWRIYQEHKYKISNISNKSSSEKIRTLIIGAGVGGSLFIKSLQRHPNGIHLVGIVDEDSAKQQAFLYGVPVLGFIKDIPELVKFHKVEQVTIAIPSLTTKEMNKIVNLCAEMNINVNQMPSIEDVLQGKIEVSKFREIDVVDLLGRDEVKLDMNLIAAQLNGKTILVSGAGGSIGSEVCRQIVQFSPRRILLLGHGENSIYLINKELSNVIGDDTELVPLIADIQDRDRIFSIMKNYKPDRVYHAAAHKHVPLMEYNPLEAVKNNIYGTKNMADAAKFAKVDSFVMISTDKAVNPPNVMGATKRIAEMIVTSLNEHDNTKFTAVRFGNVLGSRGSVIPLFKEQIKNGGPVTVTDFRMTRYFMTIPEASRLVIQAGSLAKGGEIFILDMGDPVKIVELAKKIINLSGYTEKDIAIIETGIRPGEKLFEELLVSSEQLNQQVYDKIFVGKVTKMSLVQVMTFVDSLAGCNEIQIKNKLINFANNSVVNSMETDIEGDYNLV